MDNKSGITCCCGCFSIETATKVVAIVLCVIDIMCAIGMFILYSIGAGLSNILGACACLLVIYAQKARKPWLFVPYLIIGALEVIGCAIMSYMLYGCVFETSAELSEYDNKLFCRTFSRNGSIFFLVFYALCIPLYVWFYSIILRGFLAVKSAHFRALPVR